ncbi:MAG TPA: hypothetical protein VFC46_04880 [Humisphaera sp.]|nr:hypothetical protein [Humisphaera sp.]
MLIQFHGGHCDVCYIGHVLKQRHPEGMPAISRGLSKATPPDISIILADPGGVAANVAVAKKRGCRFRYDPSGVDRIVIGQPVASLREATG